MTGTYMCRLHASHLQYIPRNMHTVFALLRFVVVIHWLIFPYPSGLLHWHCGNLTIAPVPAKQPWWIWINTSCEFIMNDCITTTKQSTTKPCAYFLGYTVPPWPTITSLMTWLDRTGLLHWDQSNHAEWYHSPQLSLWICPWACVLSHYWAWHTANDPAENIRCHSNICFMFRDFPYKYFLYEENTFILNSLPIHCIAMDPWWLSPAYYITYLVNKTFASVVHLIGIIHANETSRWVWSLSQMIMSFWYRFYCKSKT